MPRFLFNGCVLDTDRRELLVRGHLVEVQPLVFSTLAYLVRNPRRAIERSELLGAVWRSPMVSDSVVAQVIMKARRAIQDDGVAPKTLINVRGVGYRFDAQVTEADEPPAPEQAAPAAPRQILAILPFVNESQSEDLAWIEQGLTCLVHFRLSSVAALQLVPLDAVFSWRRAEGRTASDPLAQACAQLGASSAMRCVVKRSAAGIRLESSWGVERATARQRHWIGPDVMQLVGDLVTLLQGEFASGGETSTDSMYWQGQLARAFAFERKSQPTQALVLLEACLGRLPNTAAMLLVHSRLLRARARHDEALASAERALALAVEAGNADDAVGCRVELARVYTDRGLLPQAEEQCTEAMRLVTAGGASMPSLSLALAARADVLHFFGLVDEGVAVAERAAAAAAAVGDAYGELSAQHLLGKLLTLVPAVRRAEEVLKRVIDDAGRRDFLQLEANARDTLGIAYNMQRRYAASIEAARRGEVLAAALGDERLRMRAVVMVLFSLIESGALAEAEQLLATATEERMAGQPVWIRLTVDRTRAHLAHRQGRLEQAIAILEVVLDEATRQRWYNRWSAAARLCHLYLETGQLAQAEAMASLLAQSRASMRLARARAAIAMKEGARTQALGILRTAWATEPIGDAYGQDVTLDLAWMLLEDGNDAELDFVMAHVLDMSTEHAPTRLLQWLYAARRHELAERDESWDELLRRLPNLLRRFPWVQHLVIGRELSDPGPGKLTMLLSSSCE